jgi:hypothetical protein
MFGKDSRVSRLETRKQLLLAESEFNREQLIDGMIALTAGVHTLTDRAKSIGSIASAAAVLVAGLAAFRHSKSAPAGAKPSWLRKIFKGAGTVSTIWLAFRSAGRDQKDQSQKTRKSDLC